MPLYQYTLYIVRIFPQGLNRMKIHTWRDLPDRASPGYKTERADPPQVEQIYLFFFNSHKGYVFQLYQKYS